MHLVIVAIDGSGTDAAALDFALDLAAASGAAVEVVEIARSAGSADTLVEERRAGRTVTVTTSTIDDWSSQALVALSGRADLLVVGRHPEASEDLGQVAVDLAREAGCPVALVPALAGPLAGGEVVVGVDGERGNHTAVVWADRLARVLGGKLTAGFGYDPLDDSFPHPDTDNWHYRGQQKVEAELLPYVRAGMEVDLVLVPGNPVESLPAMVTRHGAAALVVGVKTLDRLGGSGVGKVVERLVRQAAVPLIVVTRNTSVTSEYAEPEA